MAQTATVIPDTEAAQHVGQKATVEGTVVKVFTSKNGNTFLNFGAAYPSQTFTGWIPKDSPLATNGSLPALEGKRVRVTGTIDLYKGKPEIKINAAAQLEVE
jgi:DNA/RNA endonuclease YhcR with UshA esterase domain